MLPNPEKWGGYRHQNSNAIVIFIGEINVARSVYSDAYGKTDLCQQR